MKQVKSRIPLRILSLLMGLLFTCGAFAQQMQVKGQVKDATGEPVIGATVRVAGQSTGTITDFDGNFTISANKGQTLEVSYIGYTTQQVSASPNVVITLQEDAAQSLNEVVVIGYGAVKKTDLTGSVTAIKPDEMNHGLVTSMQDALQGKIAGVDVTNGGGQVGGGSTIRIRGGSSLNASNDPLIVIDGLAMDSYGIQGVGNPMSMVNPNDIESFTVLKDASATAIYGSRASNGVIIITTKKGRKGQKPSFQYNGNVSVSVVKGKPELMNSSEYQQYVKETVMNQRGYTEDEYLASDEYRALGYWTEGTVSNPYQGEHLFADTDWQKELYRTGVSTDHNITMTGGLKNMPYRVSLGYTYQQGIVKTNDYQRFTGSVNLNPSFLDDHLNFNINAKGMYSKTTFNESSSLGYITTMDPTKPVYDSSERGQAYGGYWQWPAVETRDYDATWTAGVNTLAPRNPVSLLDNYSNKGKGKSFVGNFEADYKIHGFEDLRLHANFGVDVTSGKSNVDQTPYSYISGTYYFGNYGWNTMDTYNLSFNAYAQYYHDFEDALKNHIDVMAGYEWQHFHKKTDYFYCGYYPETSTMAGQQYIPSENTLYKTENYLVSFFGRLNYNLLERYYLTFTLRDDGSSRFAKGNRWGLFPSVALAWKISDEAIFKNTAVSDLKLRLGYGITGQQEGIGDYIYLPTFTTNGKGAYYPILGNGGTYRPDAYNTDITWEKTTTWNAGLDFGFCNQRFSGSVDWYYRKTKDLLNTVAIPAGTNFSNKLTSNIGSLHNTGLEVALNWRAIQQRDLIWTLGYTFTTNKSKIDQLTASNSDDYKILHGGVAVGVGSDGVKAWKVGQEVEAYYVYQQVYDDNGQPIEGLFVDRNGDGIINDADRYFYKKSAPDVTMGFSSKLTYKNWDFGFNLRASINNYVYNGVEASLRSNVSYTGIYSGGAFNNIIKYTMDKNWSTVSAKDALSDYFIQNASFLKCDNITLGYSFSNLFSNGSWGGFSGRVYATAQNVFTITKYKGVDPEISGGYDSSLYPRPFVGIVGVSLNF